MTLLRLLPAALLASLAAAAPVAAATAPRFDAQVGVTQYGIPHITAKDFAGIGYGYARAMAPNVACTVADSYVTVSAQRSKYFGPDGRYESRGNGSVVNNLNSDFFFQRIIDEKRIEKLLAQKPPLGPRKEIHDGVRGYVAGWNAWLREVGGRDGVPDPTCRGKEWVRPITEADVWRRFYQLALLASSGVAIDGIGGAQPPTPDRGTGGSPGASRGEDDALSRVQALSPGEVDARLGGLGSNAYGLGREATASGNGMVFGNPHFPWQGSERFFQSHLTVPGKADVMGGSLLGVPLILIGTTKGMAWSHTVSTARRFVPIEHKLAPGSPTTYVVDGQPKEMKRDKVTVEVRTESGALEKRTRTLYSTEEGHIITSLLGLPIFPWTPERAFALADANDDNFGRLFNHFFEMNMAQTVAEVDHIERKYQGIPWVNTIAADSAGNAYYADIGSIPHVTEDKRAACSTAVGVALDQAQRVIVLDGSRSACALGNDPDAAAPGILGPSREPSLMRADYVQNENDSYWLSNPRQPLEGFPRIIGDERTARSLRTRVGIRMIEDRLAGKDGEAGNRFTLENLTKLVFGNRVYGAEILKADLVAFCKSTPVVATQSGPVDVSGACPVLEKWNNREDIDARGALLFRRFMSRLSGVAPVALPFPGNAFREPFDAARPVDTPSGLNTALPTVGDALGRAVRDLEGAGIPLDAPLGDFAYVTRQGKRIPIHGGPGGSGIFNVITPTWDAKKGYTEVVHGSSYVQAVELTPGCPKVRTLVTYSQSTNPESPHFADQTPLFSAKRFHAPPFCAADVERDRSLEVTRFADRTGGSLIAEVRVRDGRGTKRRPRLEVVLVKPSSVRVTVLRGKRVVRRISRGRAAGTRVLSTRLAKGVYRVRVEARRGTRRQAVQVALRRR